MHDGGVLRLWTRAPEPYRCGDGVQGGDAVGDAVVLDEVVSP